MTNQADRASPNDAETPAGSGKAVAGGAAGKPGSEAGSSSDARDRPKGGSNPEFSEALDRATAAVGQDDGKR